MLYYFCRNRLKPKKQTIIKPYKSTLSSNVGSRISVNPKSVQNKISEHLLKFGNGLRSLAAWSGFLNHFANKKETLIQQKAHERLSRNNIWKNFKRRYAKSKFSISMTGLIPSFDFYLEK